MEWMEMDVEVRSAESWDRFTYSFWVEFKLKLQTMPFILISEWTFGTTHTPRTHPTMLTHTNRKTNEQKNVEKVDPKRWEQNLLRICIEYEFLHAHEMVRGRSMEILIAHMEWNEWWPRPVFYWLPFANNTI